MSRYCPTCEVGWNTDDPRCWHCGREREIGDVVSQCLTKPPSPNWGPALFDRERRASA